MVSVPSGEPCRSGRSRQGRRPPIPSWAMAAERTSRSAALVALARVHLDWMGVVDDPLAEQMLRPGWARAAAVLRIPGFGRLGHNRTFAYLGARTRFYDQFVADVLDEGVRQVVVLGAGYDSRAWRFARPGVTFFEVDLASTQSDKRTRAPAGGPTYVPADVTESSLAESLVIAGFSLGNRRHSSPRASPCTSPSSRWPRCSCWHRR